MLLSEVLKFIDNVEVLREGTFTSLGLAVSKCDEDFFLLLKVKSI